MSLTGGHLDALVAAGATAEQIVALVKADMIEREKALDVRRSKDAERQRRKRSRGVTRTQRDGSPNDIDILTPSEPLVVSNETTRPAANDDCLKPEHVVEVWNEQAPTWGLKPIRKLTPHRRRKLQTRIRENTIDEFTEAIAAIGRSPFLRGENGRGWRAHFDWMLEPGNFTKLCEGTYDR